MTSHLRVGLAALAILVARGADGSAAASPAADLVVAQMLPSTSLNPLDTVTVRNLGPSAAESATLRFLAPDGLLVSGATIPAGTTCALDGIGSMTCTLGTLAPNDELTIFVVLYAEAPGTYSVIASASSITADPDPANNRDERSLQLADGGRDGGAGGGAAGTGGGDGCGCATAVPAGDACWAQLWFVLVAAAVTARRRR